MWLLLTLTATLSAPIVTTVESISSADPVVFAFGGGDYEGWEQWDWDTITHLGFWTKPDDDVKSIARQHNVKLFHHCSTGDDPKNWKDSDKRKELTASCLDDVQSHAWDGVFFDYEGNGLSSSEQDGYVKFAQETTAALQQYNATLMVCVGGRPSYELRNYDYTGLAAASDFLFIMGYDLHLYDDYTCEATSEGNVCSPAEASIRSLTAGVEEYLKAGVDAAKLVLGLPWYGQRYTQVVAPINEGQVTYADVVKAFDQGRVKETSHDKDSLSKIIKCDGDCVHDKSGSKVWYDDAETLGPKFGLAGQYDLRGVGIWEVTNLPTEDEHSDLREAMWAAVKEWSHVKAASPNASALYDFGGHYRKAGGLMGSTCTGPGESCCEAPGDDVDNCPSSARTSDCDAKKACCCG